jgi:hypothetical protein
MKTCSIENCNNPIWSKGVCKNHTTKKSFTSKFITKKKVSDGKTIQMREMFLDIWKKKRHYSEVSGTYLGSEPMSTYFHHILPKSKYPEACFDEENIILLTLDEHTNVEADIYRYEEINKRRDSLKRKYRII